MFRMHVLIVLVIASHARGEQTQDSARSAPLSPVQERHTFEFADPDLVIELVAAEPEVESPVAIAWDADGRLYVAEMIGYPEKEGLGRITRLEDRDGDGHYELANVFAEGFNFPTSVMPYDGGLLVTDAPDILLLKDTDGDGRADQRRVLWTGFFAGSQQLRANALHWGLDNRIYGANGRCDGEIRAPNEPAEAAVSIRSRDFRFDPRNGTFAAIAGRSQFGLVHDDWGRRFLSINQIPVRQAVIPEPYATGRLGLAGHAVVNCGAEGDSRLVFPISPPPLRFNFEMSNFYNALCGLTILRGDGLGPRYAGDAFVCESLYNLVTRRQLVANGPACQSTRPDSEHEFLASTDPWFHPVFLTTGPDGALYLVDFYRQYVEHPIYVSSLEDRERIDWRHGNEHGRIWRIRHKDAAELCRERRPQLSAASTSQLSATLSHPVGWWRDAAQRLLVERQDRSAVADLQQRLQTDEPALARLHALWTLKGLGGLDARLVSLALADRSPRVREHALRLAESFAQTDATLSARLLELVEDPDAGVRFQLALSLGELAGEAGWPALVRLAQRDYTDPWISLAALSSAGPRVGRLASELARLDPRWLSRPSTSQVVFLVRVGELVGSALDDQAVHDDVSPIFAGVVGSGVDSGADSGAANQLRGQVALLSGMSRGIAPRGRSLNDILTPTVLGIDSDGARQVVAAAIAIAEDRSAAVELRRAAAEVLAAGAAEEVAERLARLVSADSPTPLQRAAAESLARLDSLEIYGGLFQQWQDYPTALRRIVVSSAVQSHSARTALLQALEQGTVHRLEVPAEVQQVLEARLDDSQKAQLVTLLGRGGAEDRAAVVEEHHQVLALDGDRERGAGLFLQHCAACHAVQGIGKDIGPDLSSVGRRPSESLLVDILDPSRQFTPDSVAYTVLTDSGLAYVGLMSAETSQSITLRPADGQDVTIPRSEVEEFIVSEKSIMPDGFETRMDKQGLADLLDFLKRPDRAMLQPAG
ncbi:c-type cytochrome [Pirellulales bacterium]|nr:c-type cytochrome [Pirellulales bacterium]